MGVQVDPKLPLRYEKAFQDDKLSYISFFSSLCTYQDPDIKPCLIKALLYWNECKIPRFHRMRINIEIWIIEIELFSTNPADQSSAQIKIESLTKELKAKHNNPEIESNLISIYFTYLAFLESSNNIFKFWGNILSFIHTNYFYLEIADLYLELAVKHNDNPDTTCEVFQKTISTLFNLQNFQKADIIAENQLAFVKRFNTKSKNYTNALFTAFIAKKLTNNLQYLVDNIDPLLESCKAVYGEKSSQYIDIIKEKASIKTCLRQPDEAYKYWLQANDLNKEVFESEENIMTSGILIEMAGIKGYLSQFDEALNLIDKAKKIEEKMQSIHSELYIQIQDLEKKILQKREQLKVFLSYQCIL